MSDLRLPDSAGVLTLRRESESLEPTPRTELRKGDRLTILVSAKDEPQILDALQHVGQPSR